MATRSTIAIEYLDGSIRQVYCHWDGYLEHNGQILKMHYTNPTKLHKLMELGDLSSLGKDIGQQHNFHAHVPDQCTFYGRDRGENGCEAKRFENFDDYLNNLQFEEYNYILRFINGDTDWYVNHSDSNGFETLDSAFNRISVESLK